MLRLTFWIISGLCIFVSDVARADLRKSLAEQLSANLESLVLNIPPRPDALPGAIFTWNMRIPIRRGNPNDIDLKRGKPVQIIGSQISEVNSVARGSFLSWLGLSSSAEIVADVTMSFPDARVIDMEYDKLVGNIKIEGGLADSVKRGQIPLLVIKGYEGTPKITVQRRAGVSAEAWGVLKSGIQARIEGNASAGDSITYSVKEPVIFAFETAQIIFDAQDLIQGKVTLRLASMPHELFLARQEATDAAVATLTGAATQSSVDLWGSLTANQPIFKFEPM